MSSPLDPSARLLAAIEGEPVDRPPFVCPGGMMNMAVVDAMEAGDAEWPAAHTSADGMSRLAAAAAEVTGIENLGLPFCMTVEAEGLGAEVLLGTRETEPRVADYVLEHLRDLDGLKAFDASSGRAAAVTTAVSRLAAQPGHLPIVVCLTGPVSLATSLVDPLAFYRALRRAPDDAHRLLEVSSDAILAFGDALVAAGADVVCVADPSATGELLGRAAFERFAAPYLDDITRHFERRAPVIVHVCGDVACLGEAVDRLAAPVMSVDSVVSLKTLRALAPSKVTMGNVSTYLLECGTPDAVGRGAAACVQRGAGIVAPACGIGARTPAVNLRAAADAVRAAAR